MSYILAITTNHNSTACLLKDGEIIACVSEERFTRTKNQTGIPKNAIKYCLSFAGITPYDLDQVALADLLSFSLTENTYSATATGIWGKITDYLIRQDVLFEIEEKLELKFPIFRNFYFFLISLSVGSLRKNSQKERIKGLQKFLKIPKEKFIFVDHHYCHAFAPLFSSGFAFENKETLVFTCDGGGDLNCATAGIFKNGRYSKIQSIDSQQSLGFFFLHITEFLGMKPIEDENKVTGLSGYGKKNQKTERIYKKLMNFFEFDPKKCLWKIKINEHLLQRRLPALLFRERFDNIAFASQQILEELVSSWILSSIKKYGIKNIVCGGGVFGNIKLNQKIAESSLIKKVFFMPSAGDESNAVGAAYYGYFSNLNQPPKPLKNLYLGPEYSDIEIEKVLKKNTSIFKFQKYKDINLEVANLLAKNQIVARFSERMEFGSRALGNRSILANPSRIELTSLINSSIKNRDFWMPFAPTVLDTKAGDYLFLHKSDSPFMNVTFNTKPKGQNQLMAAMHPFDKTTRAQILSKNENPLYYDLIEKFEKITGIGAVLNTSFNLHGEPVVMTPADAVRVFISSDLAFLSIGDYLVSKK